MQEYASALLKRIKERDSSVEAWAYLNAELVMASAKALDALPKEKRGPLHGKSLYCNHEGCSLIPFGLRQALP